MISDDELGGVDAATDIATLVGEVEGRDASVRVLVEGPAEGRMRLGLGFPMAPWFVGVADLGVDMYVGVYSLGGGAWELVTIVHEGPRCRPDSAGKV
jgi:hypothetical protein